jgi:4-methyl-5(b-hydroxyethyl)-thiazole monophosphate biosynthesis
VVLAALDGGTVTGRGGIQIGSDVGLDEVEDLADFDLLFLPGGPGVAELRSDGRAAALASDFVATGKTVAAICAAPLILKDADVLEGRRFTAHFSVHGELPGVVDERVVEDGPILTSRGPGTAVDFGLALVKRLAGDAVAREVAAGIMA